MDPDFWVVDRGTRRALVWAAIAVPSLIALLAVLIVSLVRTAAPPATYDDVRSLHVTTDHGDVEVVGADVAEVRVTRRSAGFAPLSESWGDGSLTVGLVCDQASSICGPIRDTAESHTDYAFVVPRDTEVTIRSRRGDVTVRGVTGRVDADTETGTVRWDRPSPR